MPKVIDNYVLEEKIGGGQFGQVYKGFNQETGLEVAVKTIKRETIKGKFYELLQNEIKVLKTCDNPHIMKLYALKKTANHYYLVLEYCNGGDMESKLKTHKRLPDHQVIRYLSQILTGFQTLAKHKIMHRDFKLPNILLHDDNIKIADFGFAKLLNSEDYTSTMLGSPLNMAPEVLGGNKYNNKADIWSIGACIYQMLYGKPPYTAGNMVDLIKNINTKPLLFPETVKAPPVLIDVIKKMLTADVKKRISWPELFTHPVNRYLESLIRKQIDLQLIQDQSLMINTSKYYLKKNLVVTKPQDISEKSKLNNELIDIVKTGQKHHITQKETEVINQETRCKQNQINKGSASETISEVKPKEANSQPLKSKSTVQQMQRQLENFSHIHRQNSKIILHYRNIYTFLASVVDQLSQSSEPGSQLAAYVVTNKILKMVDWLKRALQAKQPPIDRIQRWTQYKTQLQYFQVKDYIERQQDIFLVYAKKLQSTVKEKVLKGQLDTSARNLIMNQNIGDETYIFHITNYVKPLVKKIVQQTLSQKDFKCCQKTWRHVQSVLICLNFEKQFSSKSQDNPTNSISLFDFNQFYEEKRIRSPAQVLLKIQQSIINVF